MAYVVRTSSILSQCAHALARPVEHCVSNCRGGSHHAISPRPFTPSGFTCGSTSSTHTASSFGVSKQA